MKAMLCTGYGPPEAMTLSDLPAPKAEPGQATIVVKACGVNFPDVLLVQNKYQFKPDLPFAPGGEVAGVIKSVGEGVTAVKPGDRVAALIGWGGFAEEAVIDVRRCVKLPKNLGDDLASCFMVTYATSYHALKDRARLKFGENLVVLGAAGGVGLAAVELGASMGARVIAGASTQEKVDFAMAHGAVAGFVYPSVPLGRDQQKAMSEKIVRLTGGLGADVLLDPVGDDYAEPALRAMNWHGRYLVVGFAAGAIPRVPLNHVLLKSVDLVGVYWGALVAPDPTAAFADMNQLAAWVAQGKLKPHICAKFPLAQAHQAIRMLMDRKAKGKVVVTME